MKVAILLFVCLIHLAANDRIVVLSPALNEIVFALNRGSLVVANTDQSNYPPVSKTLPKVGGYFGISLEKILALHPTLVIMQRNNLSLAQKLKRYHIPTMVFTISSLQSIKDAIAKIATRLKAEEKAKSLLHQIDTALEHLKHTHRNKTVLFIFGASDNLKRPMFCAGKDLYFDELILLAGYKNAVDFSKTAPVGLEKLLSLNPDIIVIADSSIKAEEKAALLHRWKGLPLKAVKTNHIYILNKIYQTMPSDRIVLFIQDLDSILK